jgi:hypothetical protein
MVIYVRPVSLLMVKIWPFFQKKNIEDRCDKSKQNIFSDYYQIINAELPRLTYTVTSFLSCCLVLHLLVLVCTNITNTISYSAL